MRGTRRATRVATIYHDLIIRKNKNNGGGNLEIPKIVQHDFVFSFDLTMEAVTEQQVYSCRYCRKWTAIPELHTDKVCFARERRKTQRRNVGMLTRWTGRRREDLDLDARLQRQADALAFPPTSYVV